MFSAVVCADVPACPDRQGGTAVQEGLCATAIAAHEMALNPAPAASLRTAKELVAFPAGALYYELVFAYYQAVVLLLKTQAPHRVGCFAPHLLSCPLNEGNALDATGMDASLTVFQQGMPSTNGSGLRAGDAAAFPRALRYLKATSCHIEPRTNWQPIGVIRFFLCHATLTRVAT